MGEGEFGGLGPSVEWVGSRGVWRCRVYLGRDARTGRVRRPSRTFPGNLSRDEAQARACEWAQALRPRAGGSPLLASMLATYVDEREKMGSPAQTVKAYRACVARVERAAPALLFSQVDRPRAARLLFDVRGLGLSAATVNQTRAFLHRAYSHWVEVGHADANPFDKSPAFQSDGPARARSLSADELAALLSVLEGVWSARDSRPYTLVLASRASALALACGLRIGEVCALERRDVGPASVEVHATAVLSRVHQPKPKTRAGERVVPLGAGDSRALAEWLEWSRPQGPRRVARYVFETRRGAMASTDAVRAGFKALRDDAGLPPDVTFHTLRHTFASHLLAGGVNPKTVQEMLGHADVSTTLGLYGHVLPGEKSSAADVWARIRRTV